MGGPHPHQHWPVPIKRRVCDGLFYSAACQHGSMQAAAPLLRLSVYSPRQVHPEGGGLARNLYYLHNGLAARCCTLRLHATPPFKTRAGIAPLAT